MAKKTTAAKPKAAPKAEPAARVEAAAPAPKPRARAKTTKKAADDLVVVQSYEATVVSIDPTDDEIRERAYHRYLERGGGHGMDFEDWLEAERELRQRK